MIATKSILVVEDDPDLASLYAGWLAHHDVTVATDGQTGLERAGHADIVFLDRNLPGLSGGELLAALRERGHTCRVVMVTAVTPDFDILEMGFDDYLLKPITRDDLLAAVERMVHRDTYEADLQELFALASKKAVLETEKSTAELEESDAYADLEARIEEVRASIDDTVSQLEADWSALIHDAVNGRATVSQSSV